MHYKTSQRHQTIHDTISRPNNRDSSCQSSSHGPKIKIQVVVDRNKFVHRYQSNRRSTKGKRYGIRIQYKKREKSSNSLTVSIQLSVHCSHIPSQSSTSPSSCFTSSPISAPLTLYILSPLRIFLALAAPAPAAATSSGPPSGFVTAPGNPMRLLN